MCSDAPVTPPAGAFEVEEELIWKAIEYANAYKLQTTKTDPSDAINSALEWNITSAKRTRARKFSLETPRLRLFIILE